MEFNVLYCIDEKKKDYTRYLWVSIISLLENNKNEDIHIYILSRYIEKSNKQELIRIVNNFWKKITFSWIDDIIPPEFKSIIKLSWNWPIATYYRFFFNNCFNIKWRLLYLDCDTIINKNLSELYNTDFAWNVIIWDHDSPVFEYNQKIKFWLNKYINAWVLLINIELFTKYNLYHEFKKINKKYINLDYNDQDYINLIFNNKIKIRNNLQCPYCFKFIHNFDKYLIIHTINKPNCWWYTLCWKDVENIFNWYLQKTKWIDYIWYKRRITPMQYIAYVYFTIRSFLIFYTHKFFWIKISHYIRLFFNYIFEIISVSFRKN